MELNAHDLIEIHDTFDLVINEGLPDWAKLSLLHAPYVVVCRSPSPQGHVAVGIRGPQRGNRLKVFLKLPAIQQIITPLMLTNPGCWKVKAQHKLSRQILSLEAVSHILNATEFTWGPTGSTAFELATGLKTTTENSDLDLVLNVPSPISVDYATSLWHELEMVSLSRLDIQLNTPRGGVALIEYINSSTILIKTINGPILIERSVLWEA